MSESKKLERGETPENQLPKKDAPAKERGVLHGGGTGGVPEYQRNNGR